MMATVIPPRSKTACIFCASLGFVPTFIDHRCPGGIYQCRSRDNPKRDFMSRWLAEQKTCESFNERAK